MKKPIETQITNHLKLVSDVPAPEIPTSELEQAARYLAQWVKSRRERTARVVGRLLEEGPAERGCAGDQKGELRKHREEAALPN